MPINSLAVPLGSRMPWFEVVDLEGSRVSTATLEDGAPVAVVFLCNHSPYVRPLEHSIADTAREFSARGVQFVGIASNDMRAYPSDNKTRLTEQRDRSGFQFPYCLDESQQAAKAFGANCTPEFFLYDEDWRLTYHGQYDGSRPGNGIPATGTDFIAAIEAVLDGDVVPRDQFPSLGCSVKWRAGNEPSYVWIR